MSKVLVVEASHQMFEFPLTDANPVKPNITASGLLQIEGDETILAVFKDWSYWRIEERK